MSAPVHSLPGTPRAGLLAEVADWRTKLTHAASPTSDSERIELITELERLKSAAAAAQARLTGAFAASQREQSSRADAAAVTRSIASQIALARHDSPARGQQHLGLARALVEELPHTMTALSRGDISEWRATIVARETACLTRDDRATVDRELAPHLSDMGDRRLGDSARAIAQRLDPAAACRRARKAVSERRVTLRPAPDTMSHLTGLLPVAQGVAVYAALRREAESMHGRGDPRTVSQLMADLLVGRVTGKSIRADDDPGSVPAVEIQLVMSERSLLKGGHQPAWIPDVGPVPASVARRLVRTADKAWLRRLYTRPEGDDLVAMDSRRRTFGGGLRDLLVLRDQTCRTPWCDAPVRHADHVKPHAVGGATRMSNAQGLCEACNYAKQAPGWRADVVHLPGPAAHTVDLTTPTGHTYRSAAPRQPGAAPRAPTVILRDLLDDTG